MDNLLRAAQHEAVMAELETMKTTPADMWFSRCVRERANWTCERCGTIYHEGTSGLHCAHYETRDNWAVRLDPINAFSLCHGCHQYYDKERRLEFEELYLKVFGSITLDVWREKCRQNATTGKAYKRTDGVGEVAKHYKAEFERMQAIRSTGESGRIEFTGWL